MVANLRRTAHPNKENLTGNQKHCNFRTAVQKPGWLKFKHRADLRKPTQGIGIYSYDDGNDGRDVDGRDDDNDDDEEEEDVDDEDDDDDDHDHDHDDDDDDGHDDDQHASSSGVVWSHQVGGDANQAPEGRREVPDHGAGEELDELVELGPVQGGLDGAEVHHAADAQMIHHDLLELHRPRVVLAGGGWWSSRA